jgi:hypothetical protein
MPLPRHEWWLFLMLSLAAVVLIITGVVMLRGWPPTP